MNDLLHWKPYFSKQTYWENFKRGFWAFDWKVWQIILTYLRLNLSGHCLLDVFLEPSIAELITSWNKKKERKKEISQVINHFSSKPIPCRLTQFGPTFPMQVCLQSIPGLKGCICTYFYFQSQTSPSKKFLLSSIVEVTAITLWNKKIKTLKKTG